MSDAWQILCAGGVPLAAEPGIAPPTSTLASTARQVIAGGAGGREGEALAAWLFAWHDHWPTSFAASFGADAAAMLDWASSAAIDDNRYIKLRRIALENLSRIL